MNNLQYLLLFCLAAICINGQDDEEAVARCGRRLPEVLSMVCEGNYYRPKKNHAEVFALSQASEMEANAAAIECRNLKLVEQFNNENKREREMQHARQHFQEQFPFQNRLDAFDLGRFVRDRRSITQECCRKSCTVKELKTYCK